MGRRIALRRKEQNLTQEQLADKVGLTEQTISNIERGKKAPRPENIAKICVALNVSAGYILLGQKSEEQLQGINRKIATLNEEQYQAVEKLIDMLQSKE